MTFTVPDFDFLKVYANNLDALYSTHIGRYQISSPDMATVSGVQRNSLEVLIERTNAITLCKTNRESQQAVFSQLINELRPLLHEGNESKSKQGALFLLGALIHRYFRLLKEYENFNNASKVPWLGFSLFSSDIKNCRLFQEIRATLMLPAGMPSNFRSVDLAKLDGVTIVTALECFLNNMKLGDRYKTYPHFAEDVNFFPYLEEIIAEHKTRCSETIKQFRAISFLQSLVKKLDEDQRLIKIELDEWSKVLRKAYPNFSSLNSTLIMDHMQNHVGEAFKDKISNLLKASYIQDGLEEFTHEQFIDEMKQCSTSVSCQTIVGACTLLLESLDVHKELKFNIQRLLKIEKEPEVLTDEDKIYGVMFFSQFVELTAELNLDVHFFGDGIAFRKCLSQTYQILSERRHSPQSEAVALI